MAKFLYLVLLCWYAGVQLCDGDPVGIKCEGIEGAPTCVCRTSKGVIDLTKVANFDGTPRFTGLTDPNQYVYNYNPCDSFTSDETCANVYSCQKHLNSSYAIADNGTEQIYLDDLKGEYYVYYTGTYGFREVFVRLLCDPSVDDAVVTTKGDSEIPLNYQFTLRSKHACETPPEPSDRCPSVQGAPSCVCRSPEGIIDLTKIASYSGLPKFSGVKPPHQPEEFDYNPCAPFSNTASECQNVHVCQRVGSGDSYTIAEYGTEVMKIDDKGGIYVYYTGPAGRETMVHLQCDQSVKDAILTTTGDEFIALQYEFTLTSCHACPGGCTTED